MKILNESITFKDLAEFKAFGDFYDTLCEVLDINICLVDPLTNSKKTFNKNSRVGPICSLIGASKAGHEACAKTDSSNLERIFRSGKDFSYTCHAGFTDIAMPIFIGGRHIATLYSGQFLPFKPTPENFEAFYKINEPLFPDKQKTKDAFLKNHFVQESKIKSIVRLMSLFAEYISEKGMKIKVGGRFSERREIGAAKKYVEKNFREPLTLKNTAAQVSLSPVYFSNIFKEQTGYTFIDYLQNLRIEEAKKLLKTTDWDILRVCLESGFRNQSHFNRAFKKATGKNPKQFRK